MWGLEYNTTIVLIGTSLLGIAAGVVGSFGFLRGRALLGDALSHATLPGICIAFLLFGRHFSGLLLGALVSGLVGVILVALLRRYTRIKEDAGIGIVLSVFFAGGLALVDFIQRSSEGGAQAGINGFILGRTAGMLREDVYLIGGTATAVLLVVAIFYKELKLLCFDFDFAAVQGWPVVVLDVLLMLLLAVTTVLGLPAVGVVLMVAMLILPAAAARFWVDGLGPMLFLAAGFGFATGAAGTLISANAANLPAGPVIVLCGTTIFTVSMLFAPTRGLIARLLEQSHLRKRRILQGLLRTLFEHAEAHGTSERLSFQALTEKRGWNEREARKLLAGARAEGWVDSNLDGHRLTIRGWNRAGNIVRVHRLWEHYLLSSADIDRDLVDPDVEIIERILPRSLVHELEQDLEQAGRLPAVEREALA